jgi:hypothetical protein
VLWGLRLAVAQDQGACGGHTFGQDFAAKGGGGQKRKPRLHRGEDGFARRVRSVPHYIGDRQKRVLQNMLSYMTS